ncbi:hypothetical protein N8292_00560 [Gammaproteobacteria bacterium]|jgi:hypothetical protein|nr:hypothetical protein [Gammaproteobacteria bacterium]
MAETHFKTPDVMDRWDADTEEDCYCVVKGKVELVEDFILEVEEMMHNGWRPLGGIASDGTNLWQSMAEELKDVMERDSKYRSENGVTLGMS